MKCISVLLLLLAGCCGHDLRVTVDRDGWCTVRRDGRPVGSVHHPGVVVDMPGALR